jgi:hypothetical protein
MRHRCLFGCILFVGSMIAAYVIFALWPPRRPANVPREAVFVATAKIGWWEYCSLEPIRRSVYCRLFFTDGRVAREDEFLPYDGGAAVTSDELHIDQRTHYADSSRIILRNGRVLLPKSVYDDQKKFLNSWEPFPPGLRRTWTASEK